MNLERELEYQTQQEHERRFEIKTGKPYIYWEEQDGKMFLMVGGEATCCHDKKTGERIW